MFFVGCPLHSRDRWNHAYKHWVSVLFVLWVETDLCLSRLRSLTYRQSGAVAENDDELGTLCPVSTRMINVYSLYDVWIGEVELYPLIIVNNGRSPPNWQITSHHISTLITRRNFVWCRTICSQTRLGDISRFVILFWNSYNHNKCRKHLESYVNFNKSVSLKVADRTWTNNMAHSPQYCLEEEFFERVPSCYILINKCAPVRMSYCNMWYIIFSYNTRSWFEFWLKLDLP